MRKTFALAAVLCVLAVGCGSSGGSDYGSGGGSTTTAASTSDSLPKAAGLSGTVNEPKTITATGNKVEVELDDFYFGPTYIKAKAGTKLTLELKNEGSAEHNFTFEAQKIDVDLEAGDSKDVTITVPDASTAFWCEYHQSKGMQGAFIVS